MSAGRTRKGGLPLALVIARYFVYVLVAVGLLAVALLVVFSLLISSGAVYMANYADENAGSMVEMLESGEAAPEDIPACYRWTVFDDTSKAVASDMSERDQAAAGEALQLGSSVVGTEGLFGGSRRQIAAVLPSGDVCALQYDFLPVFASRELRDAVPDPQALLIAAFFVLFAMAMVLIAMRASRVIARKMRPLVEAASYIERQDLDFAVGFTSVREVNEVLAAMDRMRAALNESLHARWAADEARRRQVSALAHDLKTPLSIARWNADMLRETPLDEEQEVCAEGLSDSIERMDDYVRLLVETSRTEAAPALTAEIDLSLLAQTVKDQTEPLCAAH